MARLDHPSFTSGTLDNSPTLETDILKLYGLLPIGKVAVTRIADGSRQYAAKYTDVQAGTLPGDIVDILYPITAVLPPNTATVIPLERGVNLNLNGLPIGKTAGVGRVALLVKYDQGYVNGNGAILYATGALSYGLRLPANTGNGSLNYRINNVNIEATTSAVGLFVSDDGTITHTGNINAATATAIKADLNGVLVSAGVLTSSGSGNAIEALTGAKVTYRGRINLENTTTISGSGNGTVVSLEQIVVDGQTNRTASAPLLINAGVGTTLVLTEATILGTVGQTVIQADTVIYRGRCTVVGNVVATTVVGEATPEGGTLADDSVTSAKLAPDVREDIDSKAPLSHTHTATQITDFVETVQDTVAAFFGATGAALTYNDAAGTLTIAIPAGTTDPEAVRDAIGAALLGVGAISVAINDAGDTITLSTTATQNSPDAQLRDRAMHTGTQPASTISDFTAAATTVATTVAQLPRLKTNDVLLVGFDSLSDYAWSTRTGSWSNNGYAAWLNLYTGGRLNQPFSAGVGGNKSTDFLARLGVVLAAKPSVFVLLGGTNDIAIAGTAPAIILANMRLAIDALLAINCKVVIVTVLPRFSPNALSGGQLTYRTTLNTSLLALAGPNVAVVNADTVMNNAAFYEDGLHTNSAGASALAALIAPILNGWMDTSVNATKQIALDKSLTPNLLLTGTTGAKNGTATGNVATSWTLVQTNSGGATVVGTKTMDGNLNQQVLTVSGNYTGTDRYVGLLSNQALGAIAAVGNTIENFLDFEVLATMSGVATITVNTTFNGSSGYISDFYSLYNNDALACPLGIGRYQMRSNPMVIPAGTTTIDTHLMIRLLPAASSTAVVASVKIHRVASISII